MDINKQNQKKKKIEEQSQQSAYHMHEQPVIFPVFVKLEIFNTQEKYIHHQISFHHFRNIITIKSRGITKRLLLHIYYIPNVYYPDIKSAIINFFTKNTCYLETLLRYFENIYEAEKVYTSSDKVISPFAAKDRKIITNHQLSFYHLLQQNLIKWFLKKKLLKNNFCTFVISRMFFTQKQFIFSQVSYYHFFHQNIRKKLLL